MSGKDDTKTTTQNSEPWKPAQGNILNVLNRGQNLMNQGRSYYQGQLTPDFSTDSQNAFAGIRNMAGQSNPYYSQAGQGLSAGINNAMNTANGSYLHGSPELNTLFNNLSGDIIDKVNGQFSMSGRTGSPAHAGEMTKELGGLGASIFANNYANERANQMQAGNQLGSFASMAPGFADYAYSGLDRLANLGNTLENKQQAQNTDKFNAYMFNQQTPWEDLQNYGGLASGIAGLGGTQTAQEKQKLGWLSSITSLLSAGAGAAKAYGG